MLINMKDVFKVNMFADLRQKVGQGIVFARKKPKEYVQTHNVDNSPVTARTEQLLDLTDDHEQMSNGPAVLQLSDLGPIHSTPDQHLLFKSATADRVARSRTSSINSQASGDAAFHSALGAATSHAVRQYALPSDVESSVGGEDDSSVSTMYMSPDRLNVVTKEDLLKKYQRMLGRSQRYKTQFSQVVKAHQESEIEREKLKRMLEQSQDGFIKYKEQLKEQLKCEQRSYQLAVEEKDQIISSLRTQNVLLKQCGEAVGNFNILATGESPSGASDGSTDIQLLDKLSRMAGLLESCKKQLSSSVEHIGKVEADRETLRQMLQQRGTEIEAAINRAQKLQELVNRYGTMCQKHRDQYVYGLNQSFSLSSNSDEKRLKQTILDGFPTLSSKDCIICESERLRNIELKFLNVVAENEKLRRSYGLGLYDNMPVKASEIQALSDADMPVATTVIISLEERLRALESELASKAIRNDDLTDVVEDLKKTIEQRDETLYQLEQQNAELAQEICSYNDKLKHEHNRMLQTDNELSRANEKIDNLKDELQQVTENAEKIAANYMQHHTEAKSRFKELKSRCSSLEETEKSLRQEISCLLEKLDKERNEGEAFKATLKQHLDEKQQFVMDSIKNVQLKYEDKMKESQSSYEATIEELVAQNEHDSDQLKALKELETEIVRGQMELQFQKQMESLKEQTQHEREIAISEVLVRSANDLASAKEELRKQFAVREAELINQVAEARQQSAMMKSIIDTLGNSRTDNDSLHSAEVSSLKEQIKLHLREHESLVVEFTDKNTRLQTTISELQAELDSMRVKSDLVVFELTEQHAGELKEIQNLHETQRAAENCKWSKTIGYFLKEIMRLRGELLGAMTMVISVHHKDVRDIEAQIIKFEKLHNSVVHQIISQHNEEIKLKEHELASLRTQNEKAVADFAQQMSFLSAARLHDAELHIQEIQQVRDVQEAASTSMSNEHEQKMNVLKSELDSILEENKQLRSQLEQVTNELNMVCIDRDRLAVEIHCMHQPDSLLDFPATERAELQQTIASREQKIKKLLHKLEEKKHENETLVKVEADRHAQEMSSFVSEMEVQSEKSKEEICKFNREIELLQMQISEYEVSIKQSDEEKGALQTCLTAERGNAVLLQAALKEKVNQITELQHQLDEIHLMAYENHSLKDRLNSLDSHLVELCAQLQCEKETVADLEKIINDERLRNSEFLSEMDEIKQQKIVSDADFHNLHMEKQLLQERVNMLISKVENLEVKLQESVDNNIAVNKQLQDVSEINCVLMNQVKDFMEKLNLLETDLSKCKDENKSLQNLLQDCEFKLNSNASQKQLLEVELKDTFTTLDEALNDVALSKQSCEKLSNELKASLDSNTALSGELRDVQRTNMLISEELQKIQTKNDLLSNEQIIAGQQNESLQKQLLDAQELAKFQESNLQDLQKHNTLLNVAAGQSEKTIAQLNVRVQQLLDESIALSLCMQNLEGNGEGSCQLQLKREKHQSVCVEELQNAQSINSASQNENGLMSIQYVENNGNLEQLCLKIVQLECDMEVLSKARSELEENNSKILLLQSDLRNLEQELHKSRELTLVRDHRLSELSQTCSSLEEENIKIASALEKTRIERDNFSLLIQERESNKESLELSMTLQEENDNFRTELSKALCELECLMTKNQHLEAANETLEQDIEAAHELYKSLTVSRDQCQEECNKLQQTNETLNNDRSNFIVKIKNMKGELADCQSTILHLKSDSERLGLDLCQSQEFAETLQNMFSHAKNELEVLRLQHSQSQLDKERLELELHETQNISTCVTESRDQYQRELAELELKNSKLQEDIITLHQVSENHESLNLQIQHLESDKRSLEHELCECKKLCASVSTLKDQYHEQTKELQSTHSRLQDEHRNVTDQLTRLKTELEDLHSTTLDLKSCNERLQLELHDSRELCNSLASLRDKSHNDYDNLREKYVKLKYDNAKLQVDLTDKFQKELQQAKFELKEESVAVKSELSKTKSQLDDCYSKILILESDNNRVRLESQEIYNSLSTERDQSQNDFSEHKVKLLEQIDSLNKELFAALKELQIANDLAQGLQVQLKQARFQLVEHEKQTESQKAKEGSLLEQLRLCRAEMLNLSDENKTLHTQNNLLICDLSHVNTDLSLVHEYEHLIDWLLQVCNEFVSSKLTGQSLIKKGWVDSSISSEAKTDSVLNILLPSKKHISSEDDVTAVKQVDSSVSVATAEAVQHCQRKIEDFKKRAIGVEHDFGVCLELFCSVQASLNLIGGFLEKRDSMLTDLVKTSVTSKCVVSETSELSASVMKNLWGITVNNSALCEEMRRSVVDRVTSLEKCLVKWQGIIEELVKFLEEKDVVIMQRDKHICEMEEMKQAKIKEIQRKCLVKLKGLQSEHQSKVDALTQELCTASDLKLVAETAVSELIVARGDLERKCDELRECVVEKDSTVKEQVRLLNVLAANGGHSEIELTDSTASNNNFLNPLVTLHSLMRIAQSDLATAHAKIDELKLQLASSEQLRLESIARIELETSDRVADLKRRAKIKLTQIEHHLQTDKESAVKEMKDVLDELRARVLVAEDERADALKLAQDMERQAIEASAVTQREIAELRRTIEEKEASIQQADGERLELTRKLKVSERQLAQIAKDRHVDAEASDLHLEKELGRMKSEYEEQLKDAENIHNDKIKQLLKEFNINMAEKERDHRNGFNEILEKQHLQEDRMKYEHKKEIKELQKEIRERDETIEDLSQQMENQTQEMERLHKSELEKYSEQVTVLESRISDLEQELAATKLNTDGHEQSDRDSETITDEAESVSMASSATQVKTEFLLDKVPPEIEVDLRQRVVSLTKQIEELTLKHSAQLLRLENQLDAAAMNPRRTRSSPSRFATTNAEEKADAIRQLRAVEQQCAGLQKRVVQLSGDNATLKIREQQLLYQVKSCSESSVSDRQQINQSDTTQNVNTELEYLKNILFQYMIGTESQTLAKVICRVLKFSDEQTQIILDRQPSVA